MLTTGWVREDYGTGHGRSANVAYYSEDNVMVPAQSFGTYGSHDGWHYCFSVTDENYQEHSVSLAGFDY